MLPPVDENLLQENPKFAALHTILKKHILNPNGSTIKQPAQKERDATTKSLKEARIRASKRILIGTALSSLDLKSAQSASSKASTKPHSTALPPEILELILLLSERLSHPALPPASTAVLESTAQWASLDAHLPTIGSLISTYLHNQALALTRIQSPTTNPSYLHRGIPKLVDNVQVTQDAIEAKRTDLENRRTALVAQATNVLRLYNVATSLTIQLLGQTKHGSISRASKSRAEYLSLQAQVLSLEVKEKEIRAEKMLYTDEVKGALGNYMTNLRDGMERLGERERDAKRVLWGYGVGREDDTKERVMKEIVRVYGEITNELKEVGGDVKRLKGK